MALTTGSASLDLRVGDWVEVRTHEEILQTLDASGRLQELPFMPEMLPYGGKRFQVRRRIHKLCDTVWSTGARELPDAVLLDDLRCLGADYGGCEMRCLMIWKEAWLKRVDGPFASQPASQPADPRLVQLVKHNTRKAGEGSDLDPTYVCQATQIPAATRHLPWWKPGQYLHDFRSGNVSVRQVVSRLFIAAYAKLAGAGMGFGYPMRQAYEWISQRSLGETYPFRPGHLQPGGPTPASRLDLQIGETVRVKNPDAILATVDEGLFNRGMCFHAEMMPYAGRTFRVAQRVSRLINEKTGKLGVLKNSCLVLEGVGCNGRFTTPLNCPRLSYPYWREVWLERAEAAPAATADACPSATRPAA